MPILDPGLPQDAHPYYQKRFRRWKLNRAAYIGGDEWYGQGQTYQLGPYTIQSATPGKTGYSVGALTESNRLWRHEREKDIRYSRRLRMAAYENVFRPQIDTVAATVAKACRHVEWPVGMEYLEGNSDRWGQDAATARMRRIAWSHVFGHVYTLLEKPQYVAPIEAPDEYGPPSRMHELAAGIRTYAQQLTPLDLFDWNWDAEAMAFRWALIRVARPYDRKAPDERGKAEAQVGQFTKLYKPGEWVLYDGGKEVKRGPAPDFVPICVQFAIGQDPAESEPVGIPINDDVTDLVELRFNKSSWLSDQECAHCFNQAHVKTSSGVLDDETEQALGTHTYVGADEFSWVAPDTAPMTHLMLSMDRDQQQMRAAQGIETKGETSQAAKSGVALQLEQQNMSALFAAYAAAAECGEDCIWKMAARLEGVDPEAAKSTYVRDFSALDAVARFSTVTTALTTGGFLGSAKAELQKQMFLAAHPDIEPEKRDLIFAEIDAEAERARAASEAQRIQAQEVMDRLANGKPAEDDAEGEDNEDMPGKPNGRPMPMSMPANGKGSEDA